MSAYSRLTHHKMSCGVRILEPVALEARSSYYHGNPRECVDILADIFVDVWGTSDMRRDHGIEGWSSGPSFAFIIFSDRDEYGDGIRFAGYIRENNLGPLVETDSVVNPNSQHAIRVWVWQWDASAVRLLGKARYNERQQRLADEKKKQEEFLQKLTAAAVPVSVTLPTPTPVQEEHDAGEWGNGAAEEMRQIDLETRPIQAPAVPQMTMGKAAVKARYLGEARRPTKAERRRMMEVKTRVRYG